MKIFYIKKIIAFVSIFAAVFLFINHMYIDRVLSYTIEQRTEDQFQKEKGNIKVLFMGDSHPKKGLSPDKLENSFNYSSSGETYFQTYYKLKNLIEKENIIPKTIVLPIDTHSFTSARFNLVNEWYWNNYINNKSWINTYGFVGFIGKKIKAYFPVLGDGRILLANIKTSPSLSALNLGQEVKFGNYSSDKNEKYLSRKTVDAHFKGYEVKNEEVISYFEKIIVLAEEKNINVILVRFPLSSDYYNDSIKYIGNYDSFYKDIYAIIKKYKNATILDFHDLFFDKQEYFKDPDHLNKEGADILTGLIGDKI